MVLLQCHKIPEANGGECYETVVETVQVLPVLVVAEGPRASGQHDSTQVHPDHDQVRLRHLVEGKQRLEQTKCGICFISVNFRYFSTSFTLRVASVHLAQKYRLSHVFFKWRRKQRVGYNWASTHSWSQCSVWLEEQSEFSREREKNAETQRIR